VLLRALRGLAEETDLDVNALVHEAIDAWRGAALAEDSPQAIVAIPSGADTGASSSATPEETGVQPFPAAGPATVECSKKCARAYA